MIKLKQMLWPSLLLSGVALAQTPMDTDDDGLVSFAEFQARSEERFSSLDSDGDGVLTREELRGQRDRGNLRPRLAEVDTDGDGAFSLSELQAIRPELTEERFARVDRNGDGLISEDERPRRGPRQRDGRGQDRPGSDETAL